jgi:hypothetical protein
MGIAAVNAIVSPWFARDRPAALAAAYHGANVGGIIFSPLRAAAIGELGSSVKASNARNGVASTRIETMTAAVIFAFSRHAP